MMTKEERAEYMRKYRKENRERLNANRRYYYKQHREYFIAKAKEWNEKHKDDPKIKAAQNKAMKKWRATHRAEYNAYQREYRRRKAVRNEICN